MILLYSGCAQQAPPTTLKTAKKERQQIDQYCIDHDRDYKTTASVFNVSYSQVYSWTRSYKG